MRLFVVYGQCFGREGGAQLPPDSHVQDVGGVGVSEDVRSAGLGWSR